jgi:hypothetical protein
MTPPELPQTAKNIFFGGGVQEVADLGIVTLAITVLASLASSLLLSWAYSSFYGPRATGSNVHRSFPLISIAVTAIFLCVQFSLPLSLGLLGSLSIVRFRTPIKEPEEIGFIMLVVASSLCCASFNLAFLLVLLGAAFLALLLLRWNPPFLTRRAGSGTLVIRCSAAQYREALPAVIALIDSHLSKPSFDSLTKDAEECVLTWSFQKVCPARSAELEHQLQKELPEATMGVFYNNHANA